MRSGRIQNHYQYDVFGNGIKREARFRLMRMEYGYPGFKNAGLVRQEASIGPFADRNKDKKDKKNRSEDV